MMNNNKKFEFFVKFSFMNIIFYIDFILYYIINIKKLVILSYTLTFIDIHY